MCGSTAVAANSEDPFLTGTYGVAYTRGIQEGEDRRFLQAVVTRKIVIPFRSVALSVSLTRKASIITVKHWDAYSLEDASGFTRHNFNAKVSDYMLSSTYWPAWKASVQQGKAKGVMCSCANRGLLPPPAAPPAPADGASCGKQTTRLMASLHVATRA